MDRSSNKNEKSARNEKIFKERLAGAQVAELAKKYDLSLPRVHRICLKEENKYLKNKICYLENELYSLKEKNG